MPMNVVLELAITELDERGGIAATIEGAIMGGPINGTVRSIWPNRTQANPPDVGLRRRRSRHAGRIRADGQAADAAVGGQGFESLKERSRPRSGRGLTATCGL